MIKNMMKILACGLIASFMSGCVTNGREFNSNVNWIQKGKTRMEDVRLVLGAPQAVGNSSGVPTWTYGYYKFNVFGNSQTKEIKFYWNQDNTVNSYSYTSSFPDDVAATNRQTMPGTAPAPAPTTPVQQQQPRSALTKSVGDVSRN